MPPEKVVLDGDDMRRTLVRIAHEIVEKNAEPDAARARRHPPPRRLPRRAACKRLLDELLDADVPLGDLDIAFYRDDVAHAAPTQPVVHASHVDFDVDGPHGRHRRRRPLHRPHRARRDRGALRLRPPGRVQLAVLADRGHRELPIRPDYVGKNLPTSRGERVNVRVEELDGRRRGRDHRRSQEAVA